MRRALMPLPYATFAVLAGALLFGACGPNPYGAPTPTGSDAGTSGADATVPAGPAGEEAGAPTGDAGHVARDGASGDGAGGSGGSPGSDAGSGADGGIMHAGAFSHPGILVSGAQLAWVKTQIAAGKEPWTSALAAAKSSSFAAKSATAAPPPHICCGTVSKPDIGCNQEKTDAETAYTDALLWYLSPSGGDVYGSAAIGILNNYATVDPDHYATTATCTDAKGNTGASFNTRLQSGWAGSVFPQAAEIMRSYAGSPTLDVVGFQAMLRKSYVPNLIAGAADSPGNWELSIAEALIQIGVFLDDNDTFNQGLAVWRRRVPAYFYTTSDGPAGLLPLASSGPLGPLGTAPQVCITPDWCPNTPDIWLGPKTYLEGLSQSRAATRTTCSTEFQPRSTGRDGGDPRGRPLRRGAAAYRRGARAHGLVRALRERRRDDRARSRVHDHRPQRRGASRHVARRLPPARQSSGADLGDRAQSLRRKALPSPRPRSSCRKFARPGRTTR